jgi:hypothetical protein
MKASARFFLRMEGNASRGSNVSRFAIGIYFFGMRRQFTTLAGCVILCSLTLSRHAVGQNLSVGVTLGTNLTNDLVPATPLPNIVETSGAESFIGGPSLEWLFPAGLSVEADALYRGFHGNIVGPFTVVTWEFPVLAKYRFASPVMKRFVEAGPSFRTTGNLNGANPSHYGISAGIGVETHLGWLRIAPELRYTRWAADTSSANATTKPDQLELLFGFSGNSGSDRHPFSRFISVGAVLGSTLTSDYRNQSGSFVAIFLNGSTVRQENGFASSGSGPKSFLVGPMLELHLPKRFALEADAIHRPLKSWSRTVFPQGAMSYGSTATLGTWQIPVLAKYSFALPFEKRLMKPFAEAGPSFRLRPQINGADLSYYGVTAGLGLALHVPFFDIAPGIRYSHWGADNPTGQSGVLTNEAQLLVGISF